MEINISIRDCKFNMSKYLDLSGLSTFWDKVKSYINTEISPIPAEDINSLFKITKLEFNNLEVPATVYLQFEISGAYYRTIGIYINRNNIPNLPEDIDLYIITHDDDGTGYCDEPYYVVLRTCTLTVPVSSDLEAFGSIGNNLFTGGTVNEDNGDRIINCTAILNGYIDLSKYISYAEYAALFGVIVLNNNLY